MVTITKASTQLWIKQYFPDFDFSQPVSETEWVTLKEKLREEDKRITKFLWEKEREKRETLYKEKGLAVGDVVESLTGEEVKIIKISKTGHLILEGKRGAFSPVGWNKVEP